MSSCRALVLSAVLLCMSSRAHAQATIVDSGATAQNLTLGASCKTSADCGAGLFCLTADAQANQAIVPGGLCTATCTLDSTSCEAIAPHAACIHLALGGALDGDYCVEGCGVEQSDSKEPKCHGRPDFGCTTEPTQRPCATTSDCALSLPGSFCLCVDDAGSMSECTNGATMPPLPSMGPGPSMPPEPKGTCYNGRACAPACSRDDTCPAGLHCNPSTGLCDSQGRSGALAGTVCDPATPTCAGTCFSAGDVCFEGCVVGHPCGLLSAPTSRCFGYSSEQEGDLGGCRILCNCDSECSQFGKDWICSAIDFQVALPAFGYRGRCRQQGTGPLVVAAFGEQWCEAGPSDVCSSGITKACHGDNGCLGTASCLPDGGFAPCVCPDGGAFVDAGVVPADASQPSNSNDGGSCSIARVSSRPGWGAILWLTLTAAFLRRRRRVATAMGRKSPHG